MAEKYVLRASVLDVSKSLSLLSSLLAPLKGLRSVYLGPQTEKGYRELIIEAELEGNEVRQLFEELSSKDFVSEVVLERFPATLIKDSRY